MKSALQSGYKTVSKKANPDHLLHSEDMERLKERFRHHSNLSSNSDPTLMSYVALGTYVSELNSKSLSSNCCQKPSTKEIIH